MKRHLLYTGLSGIASLCFQTAANAAIDQYASTVIDYSTQYSPSSWSAAQALGAPDTFSYGDISTAWAPSPKNGSLEYISLGYTTSVYAQGATIRETYGNGFVYRVDVIDTGDVLHTVWTGTDPSLPGSPVDYSLTWPTTPYLVKGLKIYVDTDHDSSAWEEIDAVTLTGSDIAPVPEPSTYISGLSALGMLGLFGWRKRN